jgi:hypothetical protein
MTIHEDAGAGREWHDLRTKRCVVCGKRLRRDDWRVISGHMHLNDPGFTGVAPAYCSTKCRERDDDKEDPIAGCDAASGCLGWWRKKHGVAVEITEDE